MISEMSIFKKDMKRLSGKNLEINWFNESGRQSEIEVEDLTIPHKNKTKIIISINKDFDTETVRKLFEEGFRSFKIDGSKFNHKEYSRIIKDFNEYFKMKDEIPNIIYDIKGPLPYIHRLGNNKPSMELKKGQIVKLIYDNTFKGSEDGFIYLDKNIENGVSLGDIILVNHSDLKLKVVDGQRLSRKRKYSDLREGNDKNCRIQRSNSSPFLSSNIVRYSQYNLSEKVAPVKLNNTHFQKSEILLSKEIEEINSNKVIFVDNPQNFEEEEILIDAVNFDNYFEEKLKNKHMKMTQVYNNFKKRHTNPPYQTQNTLVEMDKLSAISHHTSVISEIDHFIPLLKKEKKSRKKSSMSTVIKVKHITCEVIEEGVIYPHKTISLYGKDIIKECDIPYFNAKDIIDLNKTYYLGISNISILTNTPDNIDEITEILGEEVRERLKLFARIETQSSLLNFDSILTKADGIIIQRGLISTLPMEELSIVEIYMIEKCKIHNKLIILQNFSLKSMNVNKPAISKISSIDFAVREGIDSIVIEEDLNFNSYLHTIKACRDVILQIEAYEDNKNKCEEMSKIFSMNRKETNFTDSLFECAARLSHEIKAELIILFTDKSKLSKSLSNYRPACLIAIPTTDDDDSKFLRSIRGVVPFKYSDKEIPSRNFELLINALIDTFQKKNVITPHIEKVIIVNAFVNIQIKNKNSLFIIYPKLLK